MLSGSSAIHFEGTKKITTPKIEATLRSNSILRDETRTLFATPHSYDAIEFNNEYTSVGSLAFLLPFSNTRTVASRDKAGVSTASTTIGRLGPAKFHDSGETLLLFMTGLSNKGVNVIHSNDGQAWGATDQVVTGTTVYDLQPTSPTRFYALEAGGVSPGSEIREMVIKSYRKIGGAWGATQLSHRRLFSSVDHQIFLNETIGNIPKLIGGNSDEEDVLLVQAFPEPEGREIAPSNGIYQLRTDGLNTFEQGELIPLSRNVGTSNTSLIRSSNIAKGRSLFYFAFIETRTLAIRTGLLGSKELSLESFVMKSADLRNWSIATKVPVPEDPDLDTDNETGLRAILAGVTQATRDDMEITFGGQWDKKTIHTGISSLDISDDIMSYQNQNNQRVSLTLGNFK